MTAEHAQGALLAVGGLAMFVTAVVLTRRGSLGLRYGMGWLIASLLVLVGAALGTAGVVAPLAEVLRLSATGLILFGVAGFLVLLCLQLSTALSRQDETARTLVREIALLENRVLLLEHRARVGSGLTRAQVSSSGSNGSRGSGIVE